MSDHHTPPFSALPLDKTGPRGNAWGLFGPGDALGMLNRLTPETTLAAASEIREGLRISTDWSLAGVGAPCFGRQNFSQEVRQQGDRSVNDDILIFNTQSSSQWDGFRHFGYQDHKLYFGGLTQNDVNNSHKNGIDAWVENGGLVGRGVLLDWASWVASQPGREQPDLFAATPIPLSDLTAVAKSQDIIFKKGDILLVRSGLVGTMKSMAHAELRTYMDIKPEPPIMGVETNEELLRWLWEQEFAAVGGDMLTFEMQPPRDPAFYGHEWLIAGWGLPIGELFDLERLAVECKRLKRWTFFFSSMPLKVPGGIASPPNGVAIL